MNQLYLVFSDKYLDGQLMNGHNMRREYMRAKYMNEHVSVIEVDADLKHAFTELLNELDA